MVAAKCTDAEHRHWSTMADAEGATLSNKIRMLLVKEYGLPKQKEMKHPVS